MKPFGINAIVLLFIVLASPASCANSRQVRIDSAVVLLDGGSIDVRAFISGKGRIDVSLDYSLDRSSAEPRLLIQQDGESVNIGSEMSGAILGLFEEWLDLSASSDLGPEGDVADKLVIRGLFERLCADPGGANLREVDCENFRVGPQ